MGFISHDRAGSTSYSSSANRYPTQEHGHIKFVFSYNIRTLDSSIYTHTTKMNEVKTEKNNLNINIL